MGSQHPVVDVAPQQELPPVPTRSAAWAYFSLTTSLMLAAVFSVGMVPFYLQI
jgi:hypothetical protein